MIAKLKNDAHDTTAFTELDTCTHGLTCASSSAAQPDVPFDCSRFDMTTVVDPEAVSCGRTCSATECCVFPTAADLDVPSNEEDVETVVKAHHVLNHVTVDPIIGCEAQVGEAAESCKPCIRISTLQSRFMSTRSFRPMWRIYDSMLAQASYAK